MAVILVTGCSSGFGKLAVQEFSGAGHKVFSTMRDPGEKNHTVADELSRLRGVRVLELDVCDELSVERAANAVLSSSSLDVVVHNAGIGVNGVAEGSTPEQFQQVMEVNLIGVHRLNRALLPHFRKQRSGQLFYVSSGLGRTVLPYLSLYCASKYALEAYAETLAYELLPHGIDTTILEPGAYPTNFRSNILEPDDEMRLKEYPIEQAEALHAHEGIREMLGSEMAPDPRDLTNAMLKVIEMPRGERPLRVALRKDSGGLKMINQICGEVQGALLRGMKLEHRMPKRPQL
ncbi:MAG: SDR family oxidoreductase [Calditrichaeota bacterium]|nr:SDR family oxidoreductase [Calditrichota bacterium]